MSKQILVFLVMSMVWCTMASAQPNLYFINRAKHKVIEVKPGNQLSIKYKGYLGQPEFVKQAVTDINDSMITLGIDPQLLGGMGKALENNPKFVYRKIRIADITMFRRMTAGRQLLKQSLLLTNIVASFFVVTGLNDHTNLTSAEVFFASAGIGLVTAIIIHVSFPENPKYRLEEGWEVTVGYVKPKL
jgi:hypothetical protein